MTYVTTSRTAPHGLIERIAVAYSAMQTRLNQRRVYNTTLHELGTLSERDLADLGISRYDIGAIAYEAAYGK